MNVDELQAKTEKILDEYEKLSGISTFQMFDDRQISKYFNMPIEQLNKLSAMECAEGAYVLAQYSYYMQRLYNRESAKNKFAHNQMNKLICDKLSNYDTYMKYEHKVELIAKENTAVERLQNIIVYTSQIMERLNFLSSSIKNMCEMMSNIQKAKSYQHKANSYEY